MKTTVINLWGGPGSGKSTLAAALFAELKKSGESVELVTEFVKEWAWEKRNIGRFDQLTIAAHQIARESRLFGKVRYVVTDSPALLAPFYESYYHITSIALPAVQSYVKEAVNTGVEFQHYVLPEPTNYRSEGRYQTEEQASLIHGAVLRWIQAQQLTFTLLDARSPEQILKTIKEAKK